MAEVFLFVEQEGFNESSSEAACKRIKGKASPDSFVVSPPSDECLQYATQMAKNLGAELYVCKELGDQSELPPGALELPVKVNSSIELIHYLTKGFDFNNFVFLSDKCFPDYEKFEKVMSLDNLECRKTSAGFFEEERSEVVYQEIIQELPRYLEKAYQLHVSPGIPPNIPFQLEQSQGTLKLGEKVSELSKSIENLSCLMEKFQTKVQNHFPRNEVDEANKLTIEKCSIKSDDDSKNWSVKIKNTTPQNFFDVEVFQVKVNVSGEREVIESIANFHFVEGHSKAEKVIELENDLYSSYLVCQSEGKIVSEPYAVTQFYFKEISGNLVYVKNLSNQVFENLQLVSPDNPMPIYLENHELLEGGTYGSVYKAEIPETQPEGTPYYVICGDQILSSGCKLKINGN